MKNTLVFTLFNFCILLATAGCEQSEQAVKESAKPMAQQPAPPVNIIEVDAAGMRFSGGNSVGSGWTTIRLNNRDNMLHFGMLARLPEGVTPTAYSDDLGTVFQRAYNLMIEGKNEEVAAVFTEIPDWVPELTYHGGPGFISGAMSAESTQYLEPGNYLLECYVKTNGIFHSFSPVKGQLAMLLPITVTEAPGNMAEPEANVTLTINDTGFQISGGQLQKGQNSIRVIFETQTRYPSFVGQDVHIMRIESENDRQAALDWMDWQQPSGLLVPSPVTFVGGINDVMPAGSTGYFTADLSPGSYAFIAEAPDADEKGLFMEFEIQ